ncbi:MAG: aminoglycoside phosphotransferase family protein [Chloroflexota bacterium]
MSTNLKPLFILPDHANQRALLMSQSDGWSLLACEITRPDGSEAAGMGYFNTVLKAELGIDVTIRYLTDWPDPEIDDVVIVFTLENHSPDWELSNDGRWIDRNELDSLTFIRPLHRSLLESWFAEAKAEPLVPWWGIGWFAEVTSWMTEQLRGMGISITAPVEQVRIWHGSTILRVTTDAGDVYLKAVAHTFAQEAELMQMIARWQPERIPNILAVEPERHWILMQDIGGRDLGETSEIAAWEETLRAYAQLQMRSLAFMDQLLSVPLCDWRLKPMENTIETVVAQAPLLLQDHPMCPSEADLAHWQKLLPDIKAVCVAASGYNIPCTLEHGDFHDGMNIRVTEKGPVFYDWAESSISHPFFSLVELLLSENLPNVPDVKARLRDAYLTEWTAYEPLERLQELYQLTERLRILHWTLHFAHQLATYQQCLADRPILPYSVTEFAIRHAQGIVADLFKDLFSNANEAA